ncbi:Protein of unknown function [Bacillus wiedmannii]
MHGGG